MLPFCGCLAASTSLLPASPPDTPARHLSFHDTLSPLTPSLTSPSIDFSSGTPPTLPPLLPHSWIPSVPSRIRRMFSRHYFLRPNPFQHVQPFLLHRLIRARLLPYPRDVRRLLLFRAALSSALHILSRLLHASRRLPGLLKSACGLPPSSPAS